MANSRQIKDHNGVIFPSVKALAEHYGLNEATLDYRLTQAKWDIKKALLTPLKGKTTDHKGIEYPSLTQMAKAYKIAPPVLQYRLQQKWPLEKALTTPVQKPLRITDHKNQTYASLSELAKKYGATTSTLRRRIQESGWDIEQALTQPKRQYRSETKDHNGNVYTSLREMADAYDINYATLRDRLYTKKMSIKDALTVQERQITYRNEKYQSFKEICDKYGAPYTHTVKVRIANNWPPMALGLPAAGITDWPIAFNLGDMPYYFVIDNGTFRIRSAKYIIDNNLKPIPKKLRNIMSATIDRQQSYNITH